jgi:hypothetical protein
MNGSGMVKGAYWLGCASALVALIYRSLFFFSDMSTTIFKTTGVKPSGLLQFAVFCLVFSLASRGE